MLKRVLVFVWICLMGFVLSTYAQSADTVFTFPFHMDSRLIVFEGEMNGMPANFAFDTGAALGLAGNDFVDSKQVKIKGKRMTIRDSNDQTKRVKTGYTDEMKIGGFTVSNVKSLITEMPYLACQDFYLLGSNVIKLLNWQIDFDRMEIRASKEPFEVSPDYISLPVSYSSNRPFTTLKFGGMKFENILIDTGFSNILEVDNSSELVLSYLGEKEKLGLSHSNISLSTGAISQQIVESAQLKVDSLELGSGVFVSIPTDFESTKSSKLGIGFFRGLSHKTIINNSESTYHLLLRESYSFRDPFFLNLQYQDGKVIVSGKSLEVDDVYSQIELGEEILSINGIPTSDFIEECDFVNWYFTYDADDMTIKTSTGKTLKVARTALN
ncbi:aspartyl protease family protein [Algoriphagus namhaensis]|uniref:Aspartyl protease family protein n=1 Tax=Algoriphagus namhaensis TaxID=915353 RepID=A0ABV8APV9_9BACT